LGPQRNPEPDNRYPGDDNDHLPSSDIQTAYQDTCRAEWNPDNVHDYAGDDHHNSSCDSPAKDGFSDHHDRPRRQGNAVVEEWAVVPRDRGARQGLPATERRQG
jgi:hypothetical protein